MPNLKATNPLPGASLVREAEPGDYRVLAKIHSSGFATGWTPEAIGNLTSGLGVTSLVLAGVGTGKIYGFLMARSVAGEGEILTIAIAPEHRQQGFGAQLLDATLGWFEKSAAGAIFLEVACDNRAAITLYRRFGFCEIGRRKGYTNGQDGAKQDALRMGLHLDQGRPEFARSGTSDSARD